VSGSPTSPLPFRGGAGGGAVASTTHDQQLHPNPSPKGVGLIWRAGLTQLVIVCAAILTLFWRDAADIAMIWWNSSTFNHCLIILPILWWLVDQRKDVLAQLTPRPWAPALLWVAAGGFGWLLGDAAGVALARHLGLVMMLQGSIGALLGPNLIRGLAFPLFYSFFLVPFGEEFVPALQTITADMCMWLLNLTGIPAHIEGIYISTPTALFRVAEACSGVKFLVAMIALGALVANLCFKSWPRRILFMVACAVIPVFANGLRAFGTIYIAHHGNTDFAASFDHVFYGWIFFGLVIALVLGASWRFFDKSADAIAVDAQKLQMPVRFIMPTNAALAAVFVLAALPFGWSVFATNTASPLPAQIALPQVPGWTRVDYIPIKPWKPHFVQANHELLGRYRNAAGQEADLYIAVYDRQSEGRELVGYGQGAVGPDSGWSWIAGCANPAQGKCERISADAKALREVISYYRVNGVTSGSAGDVKLATVKARLFGGAQQAVAVLVSSERISKVEPRAAIDAFVKSLGNIDNLADRAAGLR
jgi:exosortase A